MCKLKKVRSVGIHEALSPYHQKWKVVMAVMMVDPLGRCLAINGILPARENPAYGVLGHQSAVSFAEQSVRRLDARVKRIHQSAMVFWPRTRYGNTTTVYIVMRVDVRESPPVESGEWVNSAKRAKQLGKQRKDPHMTVFKCGRHVMAGNPNWRPVVQSSALAA